MSAQPISVSLSTSACQQIHNAVLSTAYLYETGGLLLGHRRNNRYFVVAITTPTETIDTSPTTFILEGEQHSQQAANLSQGFSCPPTVVGIWHSHIYKALGFSLQDKISNKQMARLLNGSLSILVEMSNTDTTCQHIACFTTPDGRDVPCQIVSQTEACFPMIYLKTTKGDIT